MYLSPGVGAFNPEANAGWRYVGFIHGEGVWSFRLFGNVISSAVLGFGGIFRRTNHHSLYLSSTWNPFSLVKEPSLSLMLLSWHLGALRARKAGMSTPATEIIRYRWLLTISSSRWWSSSTRETMIGPIRHSVYQPREGHTHVGEVKVPKPIEMLTCGGTYLEPTSSNTSRIAIRS